MESQEQFLAYAANKAANRTEYIASNLALYQRYEQLSEAEMMQLLGCSGEAYYRLALCLVPPVEAHDFPDRINRIAQYTGAKKVRLAQVIRYAAGLRALGQAEIPTGTQVRNQPMMLAAREREDAEQEHEVEAHDEQPLEP